MTCIICQYWQPRLNTEDESVVTLGKKGISSLLSACNIRGITLLHEDVVNQQACGQTVTAHTVCRRDFVDLRKFSSEGKPPPAKKTRSSLEPFDWKECCLFCRDQCDLRNIHRKRICAVQTTTLRGNILEICEQNPEDPCLSSIAHRVRNCIDLVSVKAMYHKSCFDTFFRPNYNNNIHNVDDEKKAADQDEKPADDEDGNLKRKPGKPKDPVTETAYKTTCEWLEGVAEPKSLRDVESNMAVITGAENMWSRLCNNTFKRR